MMIIAKHITKEGHIYHSINKISVNIKEYIADDNRLKLIHKPLTPPAPPLACHYVQFFEHSNENKKKLLIYINNIIKQKIK